MSCTNTTKKYKTRDGREPVIYTWDSGDDCFPIHGAVKSGHSMRLVSWTGRGYANRAIEGAESLDLIEVKPERWHPIYRRDDGSYFMCSDGWPTKESAMGDKSVAYGKPVDAWKAPE